MIKHDPTFKPPTNYQIPKLQKKLYRLKSKQIIISSI
jgi:hypothetical protein